LLYTHSASCSASSIALLSFIPYSLHARISAALMRVARTRVFVMLDRLVRSPDGSRNAVCASY
jgi:hypothetical protein